VVVFFWAVLLKLQKKPKYLVWLFPRKKCVLSLTKNALGRLLGNIFINSSGADFSYIFPGNILGKIPRKFFPQKCWEKIEFSAEKVLKNRFSKKIDFPRKNMSEKSAPGHREMDLLSM
jgi:hypothetical protein